MTPEFLAIHSTSKTHNSKIGMKTSTAVMWGAVLISLLLIVFSPL